MLISGKQHRYPVANRTVFLTWFITASLCSTVRPLSGGISRTPLWLVRFPSNWSSVCSSRNSARFRARILLPPRDPFLSFHLYMPALYSRFMKKYLSTDLVTLYSSLIFKSKLFTSHVGHHYLQSWLPRRTQRFHRQNQHRWGTLICNVWKRVFTKVTYGIVHDLTISFR